VHCKSFCTALVLVLMTIAGSCHRMPAPGQGDPRLDERFRTPEKTFATWVAASLAADEQAIKECYWQDMGAEELAAWLEVNLRPRARSFFKGALLTDVKPCTRVEVNFTFRNGLGETTRGVMVLTRNGWKIQSW